MVEIIDKLATWFQQIGVSESITLLLLRICILLAMFIVALVIDRICRKAIVPVIRKITTRTEFKWDDYLLGDQVLNDVCTLIAPIVVYILMSFALPDDSIMSFVLKLCRVYIIAVFM